MTSWGRCQWFYDDRTYISFSTKKGDDVQGRVFFSKIVWRHLWTTHCVNFINILRSHFSYKSLLNSFSLLRFWLWTNLRTKNVHIKCWWNWLLAFLCSEFGLQWPICVKYRLPSLLTIAVYFLLSKLDIRGFFPSQFYGFLNLVVNKA